MTETIEFPREYGYVVLVLVSYTLLNMWMSLQVGNARKKYRVPYPNLYASEERNKDAKVFNCVQVVYSAFCFHNFLPLIDFAQGHQNAIEIMPVFFATLLVGGLYCPLAATGLGAFYTLGRFFYFKGYSTGIPEKRMKAGIFSFLSLFGLVICTALFGANLVMKLIN